MYVTIVTMYATPLSRRRVIQKKVRTMRWKSEFVSISIRQCLSKMVFQSKVFAIHQR